MVKTRKRKDGGGLFGLGTKVVPINFNTFIPDNKTDNNNVYNFNDDTVTDNKNVSNGTVTDNNNVSNDTGEIELNDIELKPQQDTESWNKMDVFLNNNSNKYSCHIIDKIAFIHNLTTILYIFNIQNQTLIYDKNLYDSNNLFHSEIKKFELNPISDTFSRIKSFIAQFHKKTTMGGSKKRKHHKTKRIN